VLPEVQGPDGAWEAAQGPAAPRTDDRVDKDDLYDRVVPGRYRLREQVSGCVTDTVEIRAGEPPRLLSLDLSAGGWASGEVGIPEGVPGSEIKLIVECEGIDLRGLGGWAAMPLSSGSRGFEREVGRDPAGAATFKVSVPGDRPFTIRASHPDCVADPTTGSVTVTTPTEGLRLRLLKK
jgi:hypothetical protein